MSQDQLSVFDLPIVEEIPLDTIVEIQRPQTKPIVEESKPAAKSKRRAKSADQEVQNRLTPTERLIEHLEVKALVYLQFMRKIMQNSRARNPGNPSPATKAELVRLQKMRMELLQRSRDLRQTSPIIK